MRPQAFRPPALFTDEDVAAVDREIEEALASVLRDSPGEEAQHASFPGPEEAEDAPEAMDGIIAEGFFDEEAEAAILSGEAEPFRHEGQAAQSEGYALPALTVAWMVPAFALAAGGLTGDLDGEAAWNAAAALSLAFLLAASVAGRARRVSVAIAAAVHAVFLERLTAGILSNPADPAAVAGAAAGWLLLAAAAAWLAAPRAAGLLRNGGTPDQERRDPVL